MKILFRFRMFLAAAVTLSGCATHSNMNIFPDYRHPLFHQQRIITMRPERPVEETSPARKETSTRAVRVASFSHPLLNRWADRPLAEDPVRKRLYLAPAGSDPVDLRLALASRARSMLKKSVYVVNGKRFRKDCSGFVLSVLAQQGIDTNALLSHSGGKGGVPAIYRSLEKRGLVHQKKVPAIGDLVFFNHTYDRNGDGRTNDPLTHIGIVERVDPDGTVTFIHRVRRGVLRYKMNRFSPDSRRSVKSRKVLNHYIRITASGSARRQKRLTGQLFHAFATIYR
jgi:peptidoglycan DL-endopeptidase CwlO